MMSNLATMEPQVSDGLYTAAANTFRISKFTNENNRQLTKSISLGDDGRPKSDGGACFMTRGVGQNFTLGGPKDLADLIDRLDSFEALSLGVIATTKVGRQPDNRVNVVAAHKLREPRDGVIARTAQYVAIQPGEAGFMLLDIDFKGMPAAVAEAIEANGGVLETICSECPGLKLAGSVERASTSAGISNNETGERFAGSGGLHIYIAVTDAADIPRAIKVLFERLWLGGYGWINIGAAGQF
jgi:hypothetical protein